MSIHSEDAERPCSWDALGYADRLLPSSGLCPGVFAASSAGLEMISLGGTGREASSLFSGYGEHTGAYQPVFQVRPRHDRTENWTLRLPSCWPLRAL